MGDIKLADLSKEDYDKLMQKAKEKVEQEMKSSAAIALYKTKKKELVTQTAYGIAEEVYRKLRCIPLEKSVDEYSEYVYFRNNVYNKFMTFVNYIMKVFMIGPDSSNAPYIDNATNWAYYEHICSIVGSVMKDLMLATGMSHDFMEKEGEESNGD